MDKARGWLRLIGARPQLVAQFFKISFHVPFKVLLIGLLPLVATSIIVRLMQVEQQLLAGSY